MSFLLKFVSKKVKAQQTSLSVTTAYICISVILNLAIDNTKRKKSNAFMCML